jgi:hypothetical protein
LPQPARPLIGPHNPPILQSFRFFGDTLDSVPTLFLMCCLHHKRKATLRWGRNRTTGCQQRREWYQNRLFVHRPRGLCPDARYLSRVSIAHRFPIMRAGGNVSSSVLDSVMYKIAIVQIAPESTTHPRREAPQFSPLFRPCELAIESLKTGRVIND